MRTVETESRCRTESYGYHMAIAFSYGAQVAFPERWVSALQTGPQGTHLSRLMAVACCCQQWGDPWGSEEIDQKQKGMYRGILYNYVVLCIYIIQYYTWNSLSHVIYNHMYIYIYMMFTSTWETSLIGTIWWHKLGRLLKDRISPRINLVYFG